MVDAGVHLLAAGEAVVQWEAAEEAEALKKVVEAAHLEARPAGEAVLEVRQAVGAEAEAHSTAEEEQAGAYCLAAVAAGAQSSVVAVGVLIEISRVACAVQGQWAQQGPCWGPRRSSGGAVTGIQRRCERAGRADADNHLRQMRSRCRRQLLRPTNSRPASPSAHFGGPWAVLARWAPPRARWGSPRGRAHSRTVLRARPLVRRGRSARSRRS